MKKTEYILSGRDEDSNLRMEEIEIKEVKDNKYLCRRCDKDGRIEKDVKNRVNPSRVTIGILNSIWWDEQIKSCGKHIDVPTRSLEDERSN